MIVGVDAGMLGVTDERLKVGVYRVAYNLLKYLATIDTKNTYRLYSFLPVPKFGNTMHSIILSPARGYQRIRLPLELRNHPIDVFLALGQALPPFLNVPSIGYVHDVAFWFHPEVYEGSLKKLERNTAYVVKTATHLVAVSETTKRDVTDFYLRDPATISVCYNGVDERFTPRGKKHTRKHSYFLFVGSLNKAKNISFLIKSFAALADKSVDLLLVGGNYWPDPAIDEAIARYKLNRRVIKIGYVADDKLPAYYRGAIAYVTTAFHEGFCLPAVESMACGTPVIGVNRGALREIVGDAGLIVEPQQMSEAMNKILGNRSRLAKQSLGRANAFSWKSSAEKLLALIHAYTTD